MPPSTVAAAPILVATSPPPEPPAPPKQVLRRTFEDAVERSEFRAKLRDLDHFIHEEIKPAREVIANFARELIPKHRKGEDISSDADALAKAGAHLDGVRAVLFKRFPQDKRGYAEDIWDVLKEPPIPEVITRADVYARLMRGAGPRLTYGTLQVPEGILMQKLAALADWEAGCTERIDAKRKALEKWEQMPE
jgi:hypothetical protein